ncbi:MAG: hypothetical protein IJH65_14840 [Methanobrevibacter sp.]|nr:hypothetical protein [Methanobrevibacter sp.]
MAHLIDFFKTKFSREKYESDLEMVKKEDNPKRLSYIARHNVFPKVRLEAVSRISEESVLADIAKNDSNKNVRQAAIAKISDESVLVDISRNDSNRSVWLMAKNRLNELGCE